MATLPPISSQNRRHGVIFRGHAQARIPPICEAEGATFNEQWSIQRRGTLLAQRLSDGFRWRRHGGRPIPAIAEARLPSAPPSPYAGR